MMQTYRGIVLLLWGLVAIQLLCHQAAAQGGGEDPETNFTPGEEAAPNSGGASDEADPEATEVDTTQGTKPVAFENGNGDSLQLGKPVDGYDLTTGNRAAPSGHKLILVADSTDGAVTRLTTNDDIAYQFSRYNIGSGAHRPIAVEYDLTEDFIYWTSVNGANSLVARFPYANGAGLRLDGQLASVPDGIAVDVISRNLYWTDTGINRIIVSRLDGSFRKTLITQGLDEPRAIVVDPNAGYMYWTDWGNPSKIERALMDGTQRSVIVNVVQGHWPNGLALDTAANRLYWCNGATGEIWTSGVNGSHPSPSKLLTHNNAHLFGIAVDETYLYWTAWNIPGIHRISKSLQGYVNLNLPHFQKLNDIHVRTDANTPTPPNACSTSNGNCAQLCLPVPDGGRTCACQDGWSLGSDAQSCISDACQPNPCQNGGQCIGQDNSYTCSCLTGFSGVYCQINDDDCAPTNPCQNGGRCVDGINSYTCVCPDGFWGQQCEIAPTTSQTTVATRSVCEPGWYHHEGTCYCLLTSPSTYSEAARSCAELDVYGRLAVVKRPSTHEFLLDYVESQDGGSPWIGIDDGTTEGIWKYVDGDLVSDPFNEWADGTWNSRKKDCVRMSEIFGYHWQPVPCNTRSSFLCEYPVVPPTDAPTTTPQVVERCEADTCNQGGICIDGPSSYTCYCLPGYVGDHCETETDECDPDPCQNGGVCTDGQLSYTCKCPSGFGGVNCELTCPSGFSLFGDQCYWFSPNAVRKNVATAETDCDARGARLACVRDEETHNFIKMTISTTNRRPHWIGLSDRAVEGTFLHSDGTALGSFRPFRTNSNINSSWRDCILMWPGSAYQWLYWSCSSRRNYICQKPASP